MRRVHYTQITLIFEAHRRNLEELEPHMFGIL